MRRREEKSKLTSLKSPPPEHLRGEWERAKFENTTGIGLIFEGEQKDVGNLSLTVN